MQPHHLLVVDPGLRYINMIFGVLFFGVMLVVSVILIFVGNYTAKANEGTNPRAERFGMGVSWAAKFATAFLLFMLFVIIRGNTGPQ